MVSFGMLRRVALVRTDVSAEHSASFIRVTRIGSLGTLAVTRSVHRLLVTASVVPLRELIRGPRHISRHDRVTFRTAVAKGTLVQI
jgi:hypothetical protein